MALTMKAFANAGGGTPAGLVLEFVTGTGGSTAGFPMKIGEATLPLASSITAVKCVGDTTAEVVLGCALDTVSAGAKCRVLMATGSQLFAMLPDDSLASYEVGTAYGFKATTCAVDSADTTNGMFQVLFNWNDNGTDYLVGVIVPSYRNLP